MEIERKYLIRYPDLKVLEERAQASDIVQTYLTGGPVKGSERVRKRRYGDRVEYTHTLKQHITDVTRTEDERELSRAEYESLLKRADPERMPIQKKRYCLSYEGRLFEIDVYPFWDDRAVLETELEDEAQQFSFPPELRIIRELSHDRRYTNAAMARSIPREDID